MGNTFCSQDDEGSWLDRGICVCGTDRYNKKGVPNTEKLKKFKTLNLIEINQPWFVEVGIGENKYWKMYADIICIAIEMCVKKY